jgi:fibronectin-binding autotransporter adhesin
MMTLCLYCRLLLLMLWTALSAICVQAQLCSSKPVTMTIAKAEDAAKLATAALCDNASITVAWQGNVQLADTIVVGNGTSLAVTGASAKTAIIDGGNAVQLFDVWGQLTLINLTLSNGNTTDFGGAIYNRVNSRVAISGSVFTGHQASYGGAICSDSEVTISDTAFSNNFASETGGAVYSEVNSTMAVSYANFDSNTAGGGGGALYAGNNSVCSISNNTVFTNNSAPIGGAVYTDTSSNLTLSDCVFQKNRCSDSGGAAYIGLDCTAIVSNTTFTNNKADIGGAIYTDVGSVLTVSSSTFYANAAVSNGGGIDAFGTVDVTDSRFSDHYAQFGAAIVIEKNQTATFYGCTFTSNYANSTAGAVYVEESCNVTLYVCKFVNNRAQYNAGSIMAYAKSVVDVTTSNFTNGNAAVGGVMIAFTESVVTLSHVRMSNNTAVDGGAISVQAELNVYYSSFTNNTAQSRGGAIVGDASSFVYMSDCSLSNNTCQGTCTLLL